MFWSLIFVVGLSSTSSIAWKISEKGNKNQNNFNSPQKPDGLYAKIKSKQNSKRAMRVDLRTSGFYYTNPRPDFEPLQSFEIDIGENVQVPTCKSAPESILGASPQSPFIKKIIGGLLLTLSRGETRAIYKNLNLVREPLEFAKNSNKLKSAPVKDVWSVSGEISFMDVTRYAFFTLSTTAPLIQASGENLALLRAKCTAQCEISIKLEVENGSDKITFTSNIKNSVEIKDIHSLQRHHEVLKDQEIVVNMALLNGNVEFLLFLENMAPQIYARIEKN